MTTDITRDTIDESLTPTKLNQIYYPFYSNEKSVEKSIDNRNVC